MPDKSLLTKRAAMRAQPRRAADAWVAIVAWKYHVHITMAFLVWRRGGPEHPNSGFDNRAVSIAADDGTERRCERTPAARHSMPTGGIPLYDPS